MKVAILGVGLMGGSFALALKDQNIAEEIIGVDTNNLHLDSALKLGLIDKKATLDQMIEDKTIDLIAITIPVNVIPTTAIKILNKIAGNQMVMDMGSTKQELCEMISLHPRRSQFIATHPMWGTENSGPNAAVKGAFKGRVVVICEKELSNSEFCSKIEDIYTKIGMSISYMNPEQHDLHAAYVSHISHITSYALALTVLEKEKEEERIFELSGAGFESTVRLAKSSPSMWTPIFMQNKFNVLDVLREHIHQLQVIKRMIEKDDYDGLNEAIIKANTIRKFINN